MLHKLFRLLLNDSSDVFFCVEFLFNAGTKVPHECKVCCHSAFFLKWIHPLTPVKDPGLSGQEVSMTCPDAGTVSKVTQTLNWQYCSARISVRLTPPSKTICSHLSSPFFYSETEGFMAAVCDLGPVLVCNALRWMRPSNCQMMNCGLLGRLSAM